MININDGFRLGSSSAIDSRLVLTTAEMKAMSDAIMPSVYLATNTDDGNIYLYNKSNTIDATTGKFRKFEGGSNVWQGTKAEYEAQKDTIPNGTLIVITDDDEDTGSAMVHWVGTSAEWEALDKTSIPDGTVVILKDDQGQSGGGSAPIVTVWSATPSDTNIPSEKLVKDNLDNLNVFSSDSVSFNSKATAKAGTCVVYKKGNVCTIEIRELYPLQAWSTGVDVIGTIPSKYASPGVIDIGCYCLNGAARLYVDGTNLCGYRTDGKTGNSYRCFGSATWVCNN